MKMMDQLETELDAITTLPRDGYERLVRDLAGTVDQVEVLDNNIDGILLGVKKRSKTVAAFQVQALQSQSRRDALEVNIAWSDEMLEKASDLADSTGIVAGFYWGYVKGLPGFSQYESYLAAFERALHEADPAAEVRIKTGESSTS